MGDEDAPRGVSPRVVVMTARAQAYASPAHPRAPGAPPTPTTPSRAETTTEARASVFRALQQTSSAEKASARQSHRGRTPGRARAAAARHLAQPKRLPPRRFSPVASRSFSFSSSAHLSAPLLPRNSPKSPRRLRRGSSSGSAAAGASAAPPRRPSAFRHPFPTSPIQSPRVMTSPEPHHPHHPHHPRASLCVLRSRPQALYIPRCTRKRRPTRRAPSPRQAP